jgi:hypothetical protein
MSKLNTSGNTNYIDPLFLKELSCARVGVCSVDQHMGNFNADLYQQLSDVHHNQSKLLVTVNHNWFLFLFSLLREVNQTISVAIK